MTLLPFTDCCLFLGVDPKTLRRWLQSAQVPFSLHPTDARLRCLTVSQLQHLANLYGRPLPNPLPTNHPDASPVLSSSASSASEAKPESDLRDLLTHLQTIVATLQEQVSELALALLREREWRSSASSSPLPASPPAQVTPDLPQSEAPRPAADSKRPVSDEPSPPPSRSRSRALPLIQYGADGNYLAICPQAGILSLIPDSPEWFDWLSSLTTFTFQGANGHYSATRKVRQGQRVQAWNAYRSLRGRSCYLYMGQTSLLTVAHLEHMATAVYERLTTV